MTRMRPLNLRQALARPGFLLSAWPWRAAGYLLSSAPVGIVVLVVLLLGVAVGGALAVFLIGLPLLVMQVFAGLPVAALERRRLRLVDRRPAPTPHVEPVQPGLKAWAAPGCGSPRPGSSATPWRSRPCCGRWTCWQRSSRSACQWR
ncbi:hypothetical protein GCM10010381_46930 [Streptomyces xantholiticus]|nr:hypothetical protein GCM10010381_46930 [Streptomyces xantholiticus]